MDLELRESLNGGDLVKTARDMSVIEGLQNMVYLAMFGGNIEQSTTTRIGIEQVFDWWGNSLLLADSPQQQFNSLTERTLLNVALNGQGRYQIEQAVKADLEFMEDFADVSVQVSVISDDKVLIGITLRQPDVLESQEFVFVWDSTLSELLNLAVDGQGPSPYVKTPEDEFILTPEGEKLIFY